MARKQQLAIQVFQNNVTDAMLLDIFVESAGTKNKSG